MAKRTLFTLILLFICSVSFSQENQSPAGDYVWKGKKTIQQKGYVILKSGKKMEGKISLQGTPNAVESIKFTGEKEIEFPLTALSAYGLASSSTNSSSASSSSSGGNKVNQGAPICDHNPELFVWRDMGVQMDKQIDNTKPRTGYVVLRDGTKMEGELQLKKVNGVLSEFKLKADKKQKFKPAQIAHYGLMMTMGELTKNGEKNFKDEARNFHSGSITLKTGEKLEGFVAFRDRNYVDANKPKRGYKYNGLYFAKTQVTIVKTYSDEEVQYIEQSVQGNTLKYSPYEGGFIAENAMENATFKDRLKEFNPGVISMANGTYLEGQVAKHDRKFVNFKSDDGIITKYPAEEITRFDVEIDGEERSAINLNGDIAEEYFLGATFWVFENPRPTTINQKKTEAARSLTTLVTSGTAAFVVNNDARKQGYSTNLDSLIMASSVDELKEFRDAFVGIQGFKDSDDLQNNSSNETAKKYDAALNLAIAGKEARDEIVVYYDEVVLVNKKTREETILIKDKSTMKSNLEGVLMGCYTFLSLDKKDQKKYYDLENIKETAAMLDECY